jgi:hypothetical protein
MATDIRITDPHILKLVDAERAKRGHKTPTRTACQLISERAAQLEFSGGSPSPVTDSHPMPANSAGDTRLGANATSNAA